MAHREEMEDKFRSGQFRCLVNCGLYGRGWDFPALDLLAWARATQSTSLWVQGCVRLTRRAPGKENGLILDFAGNRRRLGPVNDPIVPTPRRKGDKEKGEAPVKDCPECHSYIHTRIMVCPDCGYQFPPPSTIQKTASEVEVLRRSAGPQIEEFEVLGVRYTQRFSKEKHHPMMEVLYLIGTTSFREFLLFESENGFVKRRVTLWWRHRGGNEPIPSTVDEALDRAKNELRIPSLIRVDIGPKYPEIVGAEFDEASTTLAEKEGISHIDGDDIPF